VGEGELKKRLIRFGVRLKGTRKKKCKVGLEMWVLEECRLPNTKEGFES